MRLAQARPFGAQRDVTDAMFDAVFATALGSSPGIIASQLTHISTTDDASEFESEGITIASFPSTPHSEIHEMLTTVVESCEIPMKSPLARLHHQFAVRFYPKLRKAMLAKDRIVLEKVRAAGKKYADGNATEDNMHGAVDLLIARELEMAKKQNRPAQIESFEIREELFGFFVAAYDTSATTIQWIIKYLPLHPEVQTKIRESLHGAFSHCLDEARLPSATEIARAEIPYLDAAIEELIRSSMTASVITRVATRDTEILGCHIPKGTDVFMVNTGPGYRGPPLPVDESKRSKTSQATSYSDMWSGNWREDELHLFKPERWLTVDERGQIVFNSRAGPQQLFGAGPRSCFGKKLARLSLRIFVTLMVGDFELLEVPGELGNMKARDVLLHVPQTVYVKLQKAG